MAVVVRNESGKAWVFEGSGGKRQIADGAIAIVSDEEWGSVITAKRGVGELNPLWPSEALGNNNKVNFDYVQIGSAYEIQYLGIAEQDSPDASALWTVKRFQYQTLGADNKLTQVQVLHNVVWNDRATLPWT